MKNGQLKIFSKKLYNKFKERIQNINQILLKIIMLILFHYLILIIKIICWKILILGTLNNLVQMMMKNQKLN